MRLILNILWLICGGLLSALGWIATGCLWCVTIVGIPVGMQCFKLASISLDPFGKEIVYDDAGVVSFLVSAITAILKKDKKLCICIFYAVFSCTNDQN